MNEKIVILGAGGIGRATALLLANAGHTSGIYIGDDNASIADQAVAFVRRGLGSDVPVIPFHAPKENATNEMAAILKDSTVLLDCLPGDAAPSAALLAHTYRLHYANLTEYVAETQQVLKIARDAETAFVVQTGLAPGYINVAANALFRSACLEWKVSHIDRVIMRVGALTANASPPSNYGWTWSPVGVAKEYLEPAQAIQDGLLTELESLSRRGSRIVQGVTYEEAVTSGGAADLPVALVGRVRHLDYMTLRWPGHYSYLDQLLSCIPPGRGRELRLQERMEKEVPRVEDDLVVLYVAVEGTDHEGLHRRLEHAVHVKPVQVGGVLLRAIQATTAASLAEVASLILKGTLKGPVVQSSIPPREFLNGPIVSSVYGRFPYECAF